MHVFVQCDCRGGCGSRFSETGDGAELFRLLSLALSESVFFREVDESRLVQRPRPPARRANKDKYKKEALYSKAPILFLSHRIFDYVHLLM